MSQNYGRMTVGDSLLPSLRSPGIMEDVHERFVGPAFLMSSDGRTDAGSVGGTLSLF